MSPGVGRDRGGRPAGGAPHRGDPPKTPCEFNSVAVGMMINIDGFREVFSKYIFGGILDRHPRLRIGWFEGGIAWVPWALQDAEHLVGVLPAHVQPPAGARRPVLLGQPHERVVHGGSARAEADRPDRREQGDVVVGLSAQREHFRLFGEVAAPRLSTRSVRKTPPASAAATSRSSWALRMTTL